MRLSLLLCVVLAGCAQPRTKDTPANVAPPSAPIGLAVAASEPPVVVPPGVGEKTGGQLAGDVSSSVIPDGSTLAVGTAFGLEAQWTTPFETATTKDAPFTLTNRVKRTVKMMGQTTRAAFAQMDDGTKLLDLALGADADDLDGLSVLFVLPPAGTKLRAVEARLDRALYDSWQAKLEVQNVHIEIPRVSVQKEFDLTTFARDPDTHRRFPSSSRIVLSSFSFTTTRSFPQHSLLLRNPWGSDDPKPVPLRELQRLQAQVETL